MSYVCKTHTQYVADGEACPWCEPVPDGFERRNHIFVPAAPKAIWNTPDWNMALDLARAEAADTHAERVAALSFYTEPRTSDQLVAEIHAHFERVLREAFAIPSSFFGAAGAAITFRVHPPPEWRFLIFGNIIDDQK
jgi:hypothetical protein